MKLIKPNVVILEQQPGLDGIYKQIELAGRNCYKSEDKITEDSAKAFVDRMIASGHGAMLEHGTVYLAIPKTTYAPEAINTYLHNPYSRVEDIKGDGKKVRRQILTQALQNTIDYFENYGTECEE